MGAKKTCCPLIRVLFALGCVALLGFPCATCNAGPTVTQVSAGGLTCVFMKSDSSLWGMGYNEYGQLGQGSGLFDTNLPVEIIETNVATVSEGVEHTLFVDSSGNLWAVGGNSYGQLGDGTTTTRYFPEQIPTTDSVTGVAAGAYHSLFTTFSITRGRAAYTFWATGNNGMGQLGDTTTTSRSTPEVIQSTDLETVSVAACAGGLNHSLYVFRDGSLWATGGNEAGQLGDGTFTARSSYEEILSSNVVSVAAGWDHTLFLKSDGSLWAMGNDFSGALGNNSSVNSDIPVLVTNGVVAFAAGDADTFFITTNGSLWATGYNVDGELGNGATTDQYVPVQIVPSNVVAVSAGELSSYFIKSDGSLWAMGYNGFGQLGDGTFTDRHVPVQVVPLVIPQPVLTNVSLSNTNLILSGTNGESGRTYYTLMSTNLATPVHQWTPVATNIFPTDGAFIMTVTNAMVTNATQQFYVLQAAQ